MMRIVVFLVCLASVANAGALDTLRQIRVHSLWLANVDTLGTAQIDTSMVDQRAKVHEQKVAKDFAFSDPPAFIKWDTIVATDTDPQNRVWQYTLNTDFLENGLLEIIKRVKGKPINIPLGVQPPRVQETSTERSEPATAWARGGVLSIHPMPTDADTLIISYRALPPSLDSATAVTSVDEKYRDWIVQLTVADIKYRQGFISAAMLKREEYRLATQRRTASSVQMQEVIE